MFMYEFYPKGQIKKEKLDKILSWSLLLNKPINDEIMIYSNNNEIIGYILFHKNHIKKFEVKKSYHHLCIGIKILESFLEYNRIMGKSIITLLCVNDKVKKYYEDFGFIENKELSTKFKSYMELKI